MITQKLISYKIDTKLLEELDKEVSIGWKSRNALINEAVRMFLHVKDECRRIKCMGSIDDKREALDKLTEFLVPEAYAIHYHVKYILWSTRKKDRYDQACTEACNNDCPCYVQGTCPYPYKDKMKCHRFKAVHDEL